MPAQRRRKLRRKIAVKKGRVKLFAYAMVFALITFPLLYLLTARELFRGGSKLSVAIQDKDGDVIISTFDPVNEEITNITIPRNTQVDVARGLGVWKLGSVWELGENEGLSGRLLAETITYHLKFPVGAWAAWPALGFTHRSPLDALRAVFAPYKTNLKIGDRVAISLFAAQVPNTKRVDINLAETSYLKKTELIDGEEGYVPLETFAPALSAIFADPEISGKTFVVVIKDATAQGSEAYEIGKLLEVLGAKVASIVKEERQDIDCEVLGKEEKQAKKVARLLNCRVNPEALSGSFDLEIKLGEKFSERF